MKLSVNIAGQKIGRWTVMDDCTFSASGERKLGNFLNHVAGISEEIFEISKKQ